MLIKKATSSSLLLISLCVFSISCTNLEKESQAGRLPIEAEQNATLVEELPVDLESGCSTLIEQGVAEQLTVDGRPQELGDTVCVIDSLDLPVLIVDPLEPNQGESSVVLVDRGGPGLSIENAAELALMVWDLSEGRSTVVAIADSIDPVPIDCAESTMKDVYDSCALGAVFDRHVDQYARLAASIVRAYSDTASVDLIGFSFASARWYYVTRMYLPSGLRNAVFVSPLNYGTRINELRDAIARSMNALFEGVADGCTDADCLAKIEPRSICEPRSCVPVAFNEAVPDLTNEDILLGMVGLAPNLSENAPVVYELLDGGDNAGLRELLIQGKNAALGKDALGGLHSSQVANLASVCPLMDPKAQPEILGEWLEGCYYVPSTTFEPDLEGSLTFGANKTCFVGTQVDPVVGGSTFLGHYFGSGAYSGKDYSGEPFGHGNPALGVSVLRSLAAQPGDAANVVC